MKNLKHTLGNCNRGQAAAILEGSLTDVGYAVGNGDGGHVPTAAKSFMKDAARVIRDDGILAPC